VKIHRHHEVIRIVPIEEINGCLSYYEMKGTGIPIIFVHPPVLSSITFTHQVAELSRTFQTITFDIRGHGKSGSSQQTLTYSLIVDDMRELLDKLQVDKVFLCGYSTGGSIVLEFLLSYQERAFGGILIGAMSEVHDLRLKMRISLGAICARLSALKPLALSVTWSNSDNLRLFWKAYQDAKNGTSKDVEEYYRSSLKYNCTVQLSAIKSPVLLVYGAKDKGFHSYARLLHKYLPKSQLILVSGVKHQIPTKAANKLNQLISDFIHSQFEAKEP